MIGLGSDKKEERPGEAPLLHRRGCIGKGSQRQSFDIKIGELGFIILLHFLRPFIVVAKCLLVYCVHL